MKANSTSASWRLEGTSLAAMNDVAQRVEADLRAIPGIRLVLTQRAAADSWAA